MIKIIKNGEKPKKYKTIYKDVCGICNCEFEFELSDCTDVVTEKKIDGKTRAFIKCPCCNMKHFLEDISSYFVRKEEFKKPIDLGGGHIIDMDVTYHWSPSLCKCPKCGSHNTLRNDSFVLTSLPPQYGFKCEDCGHRWTGREQILSNPISLDAWNNEHCNTCNNKNQIGDACSFCPYSPYNVTCNNEVKNNE